MEWWGTFLCDFGLGFLRFIGLVWYSWNRLFRRCLGTEFTTGMSAKVLSHWSKGGKLSFFPKIKLSYLSWLQTWLSCLLKKTFSTSGPIDSSNCTSWSCYSTQSKGTPEAVEFGILLLGFHFRLPLSSTLSPLWLSRLYSWKWLSCSFWTFECFHPIGLWIVLM